MTSTVRKGRSDITPPNPPTSNGSTGGPAHRASDLFSHPEEESPTDRTERSTGRPISYDGLFSEAQDQSGTQD